MDIFQAIIYGIVQGLGEFLPISSTAHLTLLPWFFGWEELGPAFDTALHIGTLVAVVVYFFWDWIRLITAGLTKPKSTDGKLFWFVVLATIPGGIFGLLLNDLREYMRNPALIGVMLIIMGVVLYWADKTGSKTVDLKEIGAKKSIIVGISQAFAIIPGVSRSGITMATGRMLGLKRESIAKFTFLLSTPIIAADALFNVKDILNTRIDTVPFIVAIVTSAIVGLLSIKFLLDYLKNKGFGIFAVYRFILGAAIIAIYLLR